MSIVTPADKNSESAATPSGKRLSKEYCFHVSQQVAMLNWRFAIYNKFGAMMDALCKALIDNACFLDFSDDSIVNPDAAVQALEEFSATLQQASAEEKRAFLAVRRTEACRLSSQPSGSDRAEFVRELPSNLALVDGNA